MNRPTRSEVADARAGLQRFLAKNPGHELAPILAILLRATAPFLKEEVIPVMIRHANEIGGWRPSEDDKQMAAEALASSHTYGTFGASVRAQWATIRHFFGGAE